jgi:hypothetical protein
LIEPPGGGERLLRVSFTSLRRKACSQVGQIKSA